jgi:hypothetical protein
MENIMDAMNVFDQSYGNDTSEVFAYASMLVQDDLAAAARIFQEPVRNKETIAQVMEEIAA